MTTAGTKKALQNVGGLTSAGLIDVSGTLYGTTVSVGAGYDDGTVFALTP